MADEFSDIGSIAAYLKDARERIKEAEERCKERIKEQGDINGAKIDDLYNQFNRLNTDISKWIPLLTNLQKADENKRNITLLLLVSFITNVATIIMTIFVWFVKSGALGK